MATATSDLGKTVELLFDIAFYGAKRTFEKIESAASAYFRALVKYTVLCLAVFFVSIVLKALTGWLWFAYIGAFPAIFLTVVLVALGSPLGILFGMMKEKTLNPALAGDSYIKFFTAVFFIELLAFIYVVEMPVNLETVLKMMLLGTALAVGIYRFGTIFPPVFYNALIMIAMAYTTISLFDPHPVDFVLSGCKPSPPDYSVYQGLMYGPGETITVTNNGQEFSEPVTLDGAYDAGFLLWADFLPEGSDKPIRVKENQPIDFKFKTFQVRSPLGRVIFRPK